MPSAATSLGAIAIAAGAPIASTPSSSETATSSQAHTDTRLVKYEVESVTLGRIPALVRVPPHGVNAHLPVLIVLHGRGEAQKNPDRGARGFLDDYGLEQAWAWLSAEPGARAAPPDVPAPYRAEVEAQLDRQKFNGMVVVMPYLPDRFRGPEAFYNAPEYSRVLGQFIDRIKAELPVRQEPEGWALDGISLGGRVAMTCARELAPRLGSVGSVQAAIDERELIVLSDLLVEARKLNPTLRFSLATSEHDYFRLVLEHYHATLESRSLAHDWTMLPGDHSYAFNRGPGVTYLLLSHSRWFR